MIIRVPLILKSSVAVVHRLDIQATRDQDPPGAQAGSNPSDQGYNFILREPVVYNEAATAERVSTRKELPAVRIPCQVENLTEERLRELGVGDAPVSSQILVFHRKDLERLGLLDVNRETVIKKGDRVDRLERSNTPPGTIIKKFHGDGQYIEEVRGASWGFGPDGYDLELIFLLDRRQAPTP